MNSLEMLFHRTKQTQFRTIALIYRIKHSLVEVGAIFITEGRPRTVYRLQILPIQIAPLPNMLIYGM